MKKFILLALIFSLTPMDAFAAGEEKAPFGPECGKRIVKTVGDFFYEGGVDADLYYIDIQSSKRIGITPEHGRAQVYQVEIQVNEVAARAKVTQDGRAPKDCKVVAVEALAP